jgi:hypothetical protein
MIDTYRQTVEEAARLLDERAVVFEEQTRARMLGAARALRSGLADHERAILAQVVARPLPLPPGSVIAVEAKGEDPSLPLLDAAKAIHAQTGVLVIVTTPNRKVDALPVEEMRAHGWVQAAEVERVREEERERCIGLAANLLAVYRRHFSDPRLAEECRSEIVRALRTHPPSTEPVPAATELLQSDGLPASFPRECCTCATEYCNDRGRCVTCRDWTPHDFDVARFKTPPAATDAGTVCNASRDSGEYRSGDYYSTDLAPPPPPDEGERLAGWLAAQGPVPPASPCGGCPSAEACEEWPADPCPHRPPTPPPPPDAEPFCACGRRASECDGSRAGCRTQCREEEASRD